SRVTRPVPYTRAFGTLRSASRTSSPRNVTLFHASAEKSEPTVATANAHRRGILRSPAAGSAHETFPSCPPARKHTDRRPTRERTFAAVKTFWRRAPVPTPPVVPHGGKAGHR